MKTLQIFLITLACAASFSHAQIITYFGGSGPIPSPEAFSLNDVTDIDLQNDSTSVTPNTNVGIIQASNLNNFNTVGSVATGTGSISASVSGAESIVISGNTFTLGTAADITRSNGEGLGVAGGPASSDIGRSGTARDALTYTFDLSSLTLPSGFNLRITEVQISNLGSGTSVPELTLSGVSSTLLTGGSAVSIDGNSYVKFTGLGINLSDGDVLAFSESADGESYRLRSITFDVVPEPGSAVLLGSALLLFVACRHRRNSRNFPGL